MFGTTQDITDRKRVEEEREALSSALQQSNARLEDAQRVAHIGHYEWKPLERRVAWSDELYRIYGLPPGKGPIDMAMVFEMVHPEGSGNCSPGSGRGRSYRHHLKGRPSHCSSQRRSAIRPSAGNGEKRCVGARLRNVWYRSGHH